MTLTGDCLDPPLNFPNTMRLLYQLLGMAHMGFLVTIAIEFCFFLLWEDLIQKHFDWDTSTATYCAIIV